MRFRRRYDPAAGCLHVDKLVGTMATNYPQARLAVSIGWRPAKVDGSAGATGIGPHVRGDCQDVAFEYPGRPGAPQQWPSPPLPTSLGVQGIAIPNDGSRYLVHLDPVRAGSWHVEQAWLPVETPAGKKWATFYQGVEPNLWGSPVTASTNPDDIVGDWMATSIISGKQYPNGSIKSGPSRLSVFRRPNGHFGMWIPDDQLPKVTALWDAERRGDGQYVICYSWPQAPPDKGVEEFRGTVKIGTASRSAIPTRRTPPIPES